MSDAQNPEQPPLKLGQYPPLRKGQDFQTVVDNGLTLARAGMEKGRALATALHLAGYRPPTKSSTEKLPKKPIGGSHLM